MSSCKFSSAFQLTLFWCFSLQILIWNLNCKKMSELFLFSYFHYQVPKRTVFQKEMRLIFYYIVGRSISNPFYFFNLFWYPCQFEPKEFWYYVVRLPQFDWKLNWIFKRGQITNHLINYVKPSFSTKPNYGKYDCL